MNFRLQWANNKNVEMRALVCWFGWFGRAIFACRQCQSQFHDHHRTQMPNRKQCNWWWKAVRLFFSLVVLSLTATASLIQLASIQVFIFAAALSPSFRCCCSVRDSCTRQRVKNNNFRFQLLATSCDAYCRYNAYGASMMRWNGWLSFAMSLSCCVVRSLFAWIMH